LQTIQNVCIRRAIGFEQQDMEMNTQEPGPLDRSPAVPARAGGRRVSISPPPGALYLSATQMLTRYGKDTRKNRVWLWRMEKRPEFPKAIRLGGNKFWRIEDVEAFERKSIDA
jgi:predicted DNA-binding transcriptional regulator AlpA